ncbi:glycosyl hydrolase family 2 [Lutibacter sp. Hel_I_33_5]|uniref:glycoside hydrolase family 2 TIM barrel-domain containing protein n=1 Tax=Lutibacter sp. Hel_I_33_5 TaxID=1566289 RepID=UPI00119E54B9|nr:glycoside hydrolase family 2 TIM barrel-domain containing protein [Lutibacter sp. Hel_I_33_5]TVZ57224.1 glycosyl hydrolase family 2 [Lutibacter sp. Hel_I_33_5]
MKNYIFSFLLLFSMSFSSCQKNDNLDKVSVNKRQLLLNNIPYLIKGVCYHPVPIGSDKRSFETIDKDLELMVEAGINTIRVYMPIDDVKVLNKIESVGLKVIIGFGYNDSKDKFNIHSGNFITYINTYKNHNAILMWELGNEYNYHPEWFNDDIKNWYNAMNEAAAKIHEIDSNRPVSTAHGDLPNEQALSLSPNIDVWGMNVYRMVVPETIFPEWEAISSKPMYLSEVGGDSYLAKAVEGFEQGENQEAQAHANKVILDKIFDNQEICFGTTLFSFTDGWWKAGNNDKQDVGGWAPNSTGIPYDGAPNEEYWGIVDIHRNKKKTFKVVKEKFRSIK